jgi:uncharacterized Fe-S cluster-containing protein
MTQTAPVTTTSAIPPQLPGLNCGLCGLRTCDDLATRVRTEPQWLERCIHLSADRVARPATQTPACSPAAPSNGPASGSACGSCAAAVETPVGIPARPVPTGGGAWHDTLGRPFDFYLEHFPEDPGPREVILPHNPILTREMDVKRGDILIGRPLGMSCGCPITHCGFVTDVDPRTGVIVWCVTGPLGPRANGFKDIGYYIAEAYEGLITDARVEIKIGARYFFQPRMCMLQWRHSGLVNYLNRTPTGLQVRVEGLWIG